MNTICYICLSPVSGNLSLNPCTHCFCSSCILPWLRNSQTCPTCCQIVRGSEHNPLIDQQSKTMELCINGCGEYLLPNEIDEHNQSCIRRPVATQCLTISDVLTKIDQGFLTESIPFLTQRIRDTSLSLNERCQSKYILIQIYKKLGLYQKALETINFCEDLSKTTRLFHLAEIYRKLEKFDDAETNYVNHLDLEPDHALSHRGLALINKKRRNYHTALDLIEIAIQKASTNSQQYNILRVDRADIYRKLTKYSESEKELLSVINDENSRSKLSGLEKADALYSFVVLHLDQQKTSATTLKYLEEAKSLYKNSKCDIKLAMCEFLAGRYYLQQQTFETCFLHFFNGLNYFKNNKIISLELADGYIDFASAVIYSQNEQLFNKAKKYVRKAKLIFNNAYPSGHDKIQLCDNLLIL